MFSEKLSSSTSSFARGPAQLLPGSRSHSQHSRAADSQLRENAGSPAPPIAPSTSGGGSKVHTSPSKVRPCSRDVYILSLCTVSSSDPVHAYISPLCLLPGAMTCGGNDGGITLHDQSFSAAEPFLVRCRCPIIVTFVVYF